MSIGSLGIAVPAPGGTGSYHYVIKLSLMHVFGFDAGDAVASPHEERVERITSGAKRP